MSKNSMRATINCVTGWVKQFEKGKKGLDDKKIKIKGNK
jgi:hypothetical protein